MQPLIEVIIHDLVSGKICYINGNLSKRKVGDSSLLALGEFEKNIDQIISELSKNKFSERSGRLIDLDEIGSMENKKKEGYF